MLAPSSRETAARWSRFRKSAGFTSATNASLPDPAFEGCATPTLTQCVASLAIACKIHMADANCLD